MSGLRVSCRASDHLPGLWGNDGMSMGSSVKGVPSIPGIHHVTAISGPAQENMDFYAGVLGLRMVKQTVNFDDPGTHHLYFGDRAGTPGTIMTFFPWAHAASGARGSGYTDSTAFSVPPGSLEFWAARLEEVGASPGEVETRFGSEVLCCHDPDGLVLELVAGPDTKETAAGPPVHPEIAPEYTIRSFHGVLLDVADPDATARLLTGLMGYEHRGEDGGRIGFFGGTEEVGAVVELLATGSRRVGRMGRGSVHHVAFRTRDDVEQQGWREALVQAMIPVTTVQERCYFRSIYFHEPGGVLFEIATDAPGFGIDEADVQLGHNLKLPSWLEGRRAELEARLPVLCVPGGG